MLTEHLGDALRECPKNSGKKWLDSYAEHLCRTYGAARVELTGHLHNLPTQGEVRDGIKLNNPESYESEVSGCSNARRIESRDRVTSRTAQSVAADWNRFWYTPAGRRCWA